MTELVLEPPWREGLGTNPRLVSIPEVWDPIVRAHGERVALEVDGVERTYRELDRDAGHVAAAVLASPDDGPVAVVAQSSVATITAMFGLLLAGRPALMLDPRDPPSHLSQVCAFVGVRTVIAADPTAARALDGVEAVAVDDLVAAGSAHPDPRPCPAAFEPDTPSVLYLTSGTTGAPKAVARTHGSVTVQSSEPVFASDVAPGAHVAILSPLSFGASAVNLFGCLFNGGTACIYDVGQRGVDELLHWMGVREIARAAFVPSLLRALASYAGPPIPSMRSAMIGGEAVVASDVAQLQSVFPNADVYCTYGSSEAGLISGAVVRRGRSLGADAHTLWPIPTQDISIHGPDGADGVAVGVDAVGEIVVTGPCVTRGYWGDPPEYRGVFSVDPEGRRRVRTGDQGRLLANGMLEVLGRVDHRVKVRGQGVDLAMVERTLAGLDGVHEAVVSAVPGPAGATQLVAHVVIDPGASIAVRDLRRALIERIPPYAVPTRFRLVEALPRTARDKVDRHALDAEATDSTVAVEYVPPRDEVDTRIAALFAELLVLDEVGLRHDFFEQGGDSLSALELLAALESEYGIDASDLATHAGLFQEHATVEALADIVRTRHETGAHSVVDGVAVRLTASGADDGPPVFLVPGISGMAVMMRGLALRLDGRRAYSFWARGMLRPAWPDRRLEVMAARYAQAIRAVEPDEPVVLGGYSFGTYLAFEIARSLRAQGHAPALLVIIDTPAVGGERVSRQAPVEEYGARLRAVSNAERLRMFAGSVDWRIKTAYRRATAGIVPRKLGDQIAVFRAHHDRMLRRYVPRGTYDGAVLVLCSDDHDESDLGWRRLVTGPVATARARGHHQQMLREPWVTGAASVINDAIAKGVGVTAGRAGTD